MYSSFGAKIMAKVNFVMAELKNPGRDLPRVIHTAVPLVICISQLRRV
jgi:hypothetical protein